MTTTINSVAIADPFQVSITHEMLGGGKRSANGTFLLDYSSTTLKRKVVLSWRLLTSAERTAIFGRIALCIAGSYALVLPDSTSITVFYDPSASPTETVIKDAVGYKYNLQVAFIEA